MIVAMSGSGRGQRASRRTAREGRTPGAAVLVCSACPAVPASRAASAGRTNAGARRRQTAEGDVDGLVDVGGGRRIYVRCTGTGSPTVILEGGDEDTSASYAFAVPSLAEVTRTCVYDRANLGSSDPDSRAARAAGAGRGPGEHDLRREDPRALRPGRDLRRRLHHRGLRLRPPPAGRGDGVRRRAAPRSATRPPQLVRDTRWDSPVNIEKRDYLQVEKDAWAARGGSATSP